MCERACIARCCLGRRVALVKRWLLNNVDALELYALVASLIGKSSASNGRKKIYLNSFAIEHCVTPSGLTRRWGLECLLINSLSGNSVLLHHG